MSLMSIKSFFLGLWRIFRKAGGILLRILTFLGIGLYVLAVLAPYIPPVYTVVPAVLGLLFPVVFTLYVLISIIWILARRWRLVGILVLIFIVSLRSTLVYFPINRIKYGELLPEDKKTLKVLSYNVNAFNFTSHRSIAPNPILQYIKTSEADIVCLQEALFVDHPRYGVTSTQFRRYLKDVYPYMHKDYAQPGGGSMLVLLSKYPINETKRLPLNSSANGGMRYKVQLAEQEVVIFNLHLESFRLKKRDGENYIQLLKERNTMGLRDAIEGKFGTTFEVHNQQADTIEAEIEQAGRHYTLVCGDFNDTPLSYARRKIASGLQDAFVEAGNGPGFSYTKWLFIVRIDHILAGTAFEPMTCFVDHSISTSDHYPIQAQLIY